MNNLYDCIDGAIVVGTTDLDEDPMAAYLGHHV
jgi:hypothetical protein